MPSSVSPMIVTGSMLRPMDPKYREYAHHILESGNHLLALINDILDLSKAEAGKAQPKRESLRVADTITSALDIVGNQAERNGLVIETDIALDLPLLFVDRRMVRQVLINLLSNAIKFTLPGGRVTITARLMEVHGGRLEIAGRPGEGTVVHLVFPPDSLVL